MHKQRGFAMVGYHRVILLDGTVVQGRPYTTQGAHVAGNNHNTLGICMVGGLAEDGTPKNTYTSAQMTALAAELINLKKLFPSIRQICGHRDYSPDLNGDGIITRNEWIKECPCFDVKAKMAEWGMTHFMERL
jgi:N-acetyl-anhydromuramyl-L-alanine amidase AmpD